MRLRFALSFLLLLAACAPQQQAFNPVTHTATIEKETYKALDGAELPLRSWKVRKPRAIVIALHGFNDYSNAFTGAGEYFKKKHIATYAYDQRGFGKAPGRGIWAGKENLVRDVQELAVALHKQHPRTPIFLMGESMGGAVVLLAASQKDLPISGVVLLAPAVWGNTAMPVLYQMMLWASAHTLPWYKVTGEGLEIQASNNIPMLRELGRDPLVIKATRIDAIYGLVGLMGEAYEAPPHIDEPSLLLYGYKDEVIPKKPIEEIRGRFAGAPDHIFYEDGYHMLTRDLQGKDVLSDIARWMLKKR